MPRTVLCVAAVLLVSALAGATAAGCGRAGDDVSTGALRVTTTATFLADIAQNVAGDRFTVTALVPSDADLHAFEPTPRDVATVSSSELFILNGGGLEGPLEDALRAAAPETVFVTASQGLAPRRPQPGEPLREGGDDPHFWLDPTLTVTYVENIRDAFSAADPGGEAAYRANAAAYITRLRALDAWIEARVRRLPARDRLLVMNHLSHGYFADRYGFRIVGAVVPSVAGDESPTAKQLTGLARAIRSQGVRAVFVELGENARLARQIAAETGTRVVTGLRTHSLSGPDGEAPTYIDMMRYDTRLIVGGLE